MAIPRTSLRGFLSQARTALRTNLTKREPITFVIGNESADLDSITSAILYAYVASQAPRARRATSIHVPLINIPKADISLRPELLALLPTANIEVDHLITLDDLPALPDIHTELSPDLTKWILVDHNALQGQLGATYSHSVSGVIDHHADENQVPKDTGDEPRIIETSGSCTSLITNYMRESWNELSLGASSSGATQTQGDGISDDTEVASLWDAQVAQFGLASILIDTTNLKDKHKTTYHDVGAVEFLEVKINASLRLGKQYDRNAFFEKISAAKSELDSLPVSDILRKDYKQWSESGGLLGTSSVVRSIEYLKGKAKEEASVSAMNALVDGVKTFAHERDLTIHATMTAFATDDGEFRRQLMLVGRDEAGRKFLEEFRQTYASEFGLEEIDKSDGTSGLSYVCWKQNNLAASRKQIAPMLRKVMKG